MLFYNSAPMPTKKTIISKYLSEIGSLGGKSGTGKAKSRGSELSRKAAQTRWARAKASKKKA